MITERKDNEESGEEPAKIICMDTSLVFSRVEAAGRMRDTVTGLRKGVDFGPSRAAGAANAQVSTPKAETDGARFPPYQ